MEYTYKTKKFIEKAIIKHNYTYDYSLVNYQNVSSKVKIICKKTWRIFTKTIKSSSW